MNPDRHMLFFCAIALLCGSNLALTAYSMARQPPAQASPSQPIEAAETQRPCPSAAEIASALAATRSEPPVPDPAADPPTDPIKAGVQTMRRNLHHDFQMWRNKARALQEGTPAAPATTPGWHVASGGTSRAAARFLDQLGTQDPTLLTQTCQLTTPVTLRFEYRWVRAQYAVDDHGSIAATVTHGGTRTQHTCLLKQLANTDIVGTRSHGKNPWTLDARFTPSQEPSP